MCISNVTEVWFGKKTKIILFQKISLTENLAKYAAELKTESIKKIFLKKKERGRETR
jgi:hypothetical protein